MNRNHVLQIANDFWEDVISVDDNIYKGVLKIDGYKNAGICFLDVNNNVPDDFAAYQEKLLADEYYSRPGNLQWNYYLFMVKDTETINPRQKREIEQNDKFARKYVLNEAEFAAFFKLEKSAHTGASNIIAEWKGKLNEAGLQAVYTKQPYSSAVTDFLNGQQQQPIDIQSSTSGSASELSFIDKIILEPAYRKYPEQRQFTFGKVNLLRGPNGVGKTSVFEAIELLACGKNFRNKDRKAPDGCIKGYVNHSFLHQEICTPTNTTKYRERDLVWYSNQYKTGNDCAESFNRFNFFNADAARDFTNSNNEEEIKKSLFNLVLGPSFSYITGRVNGFYTHFRPEYNKLKAAMGDAEAQIAASNAAIARLQDTGSVQAIRAIITENIRDIGFIDSQLAIAEDTVPVELQCNKLKFFIETLLREKPDAVQSYSDLVTQKQVLQTNNTLLADFEKKLLEIDEAISEKNNEHKLLGERSGIVNRIIEYFQNSWSFKLRGITARISANSNLLKQIAGIKRTLAAVNLDEYLLPETLNHFMANNSRLLNTAKNDLKITDDAISLIFNNYNKIRQLVTQIKLLGRQYLEEGEKADACPLCETHFEREELIKRINEAVDGNAEDDAALPELTQQQNELKERIEQLTRHNEAITLIRSARLMLDAGGEEDIILNELIQNIKTLLNSEAAAESAKAADDALVQSGIAAGFSEQELAFLEGKITALFEGRLVLSEENKAVFAAEQERLAGQQSGLQREINLLTEQKIQLFSQLKTDMKAGEELESIAEIKEQMEAHARRLKICEDAFVNIRELITLGDAGLINEVNQQLSVLEKNIATLKSATQQQFELAAAKNTLSAAQQFVQTNKDKFGRVQKAYELLRSMQEDDGTSQLTDFFNENLREINEIFKMLHAPKEFNALLFKDKMLYLVLKDGAERRVSEISTGQRAALCIALFINLNRKLSNGPDIILFDDPITHIDDLNALSFLDFLRFFALTEGKQVFYATANARLADLIEKKFAFLGEDFKKWELTRETVD